MSIEDYFEQGYETQGLNRLLTNEDVERFGELGYVDIYEKFGYTAWAQRDRKLKLCAQLDLCRALGFNIDYTSNRAPVTPSMLPHRITTVGGELIFDPGPVVDAPKGKGFKGKVVCDVGCGNTPASLVFADMGASVYATTLGPHLPERQHPGVVNNPQINLTVGVDYIEWSKQNLAASSVDIFLDGCSITHFRCTSDVSHWDACYLTGKEIARTLKDDGYFIVVSDVTLDEAGYRTEDDGYISMRKMIECYESAGLKLHGQASLLKEFPTEADIPELVLSGEYLAQDSRARRNIAVARLVFRKESV